MQDVLKNLNAAQREAVTTTEGSDPRRCGRRLRKDARARRTGLPIW